MLKIIHYLVVWAFFLVFINCDRLIIETKSGRVQGVSQRTYKSGIKYTSYIGIPYAQPPVGDRRFKVISLPFTSVKSFSFASHDFLHHKIGASSHKTMV